LLFLDVQMPKLNGFEVLELIGPGPAVVFVTAYDEHAVRAFEIHAVDYLLKPFSAERLAQAVDRARARPGTGAPVSLCRLGAAATPGARPAERILAREGARFSVTPVEKSDNGDAQDNNV